MTEEQAEALRAWAVMLVTVAAIATGVVLILHNRGMSRSMDTTSLAIVIASWAISTFMTFLMAFRLVLVPRPSPPRREPRPDPVRQMGGDMRMMESSRGHQYHRRAADFLLPERIYINGCNVLPRFAWAILEHESHSMSRDGVFFQIDCNGERIPDRDDTRQFHEDFKRIFEKAEWGVAVGGGGIRPNVEGLRALRAIGMRGEEGLVELLNKWIDDDLTSPTRSLRRRTEIAATSSPDRSEGLGESIGEDSGNGSGESVTWTVESDEVVH